MMEVVEIRLDVERQMEEGYAVTTMMVLGGEDGQRVVQVGGEHMCAQKHGADPQREHVVQENLERMCVGGGQSDRRLEVVVSLVDRAVERAPMKEPVSVEEAHLHAEHGEQEVCDHLEQCGKLRTQSEAERNALAGGETKERIGGGKQNKGLRKQQIGHQMQEIACIKVAKRLQLVAIQRGREVEQVQREEVRTSMQPVETDHNGERIHAEQLELTMRVDQVRPPVFQRHGSCFVP
mmetsp:Transcript_11975/g.30327  ORF Transcript_11975/g.30327 Transcript_11975/m.30327 type:complete len:236 (+) Transcript_11975:591-1298(+)